MCEFIVPEDSGGSIGDGVGGRGYGHLCCCCAGGEGRQMSCADEHKIDSTTLESDRNRARTIDRRARCSALAGRGMEKSGDGVKPRGPDVESHCPEPA